MVAIIVPGEGEWSAGKGVNRVIRIATLNVRIMRGEAMNLLKCCQGDKYISDVCKNQYGEINQIGKLQGQICISSFPEKEIIIVMEV